MGGCFHSLIKTRYYDMYQTDTKELEDSFLTLNKRYQSSKYGEMLNNHSNIIEYYDYNDNENKIRFLWCVWDLIGIRI